ncbi:MAG: stage V sporulation protein AA [Lachnoclostridium edouardi]|uniref:stage V sporulation protein AA n=1 Tax=Lachnoclostridium edouardi TaxID=1926283 RepID=UPI0026DC791E|nr:stage V sporulation protein AA [Lachnoclostridium edouardi]MDO4279478.1 stage V sporulation protein AA [Lachnoclostridium edouardi]
MSSQKTLYLNVSQITEVRNKDVFLKDIAKIYCDDRNIENRVNAMKVKAIRLDKNRRYMENVLDIIQDIQKQFPDLQINNIGEVDYIIDYHVPHKPRRTWEWIKTIFVCLICFFGAAFAIMTFNNDVNVTDVFSEIYLLVTGKESNGFTVLEVSYSVGLALGIIGFFNHFAKYKINTDPTPLEVEMRLYEDNVSKTLIQNAGRKESDIDVT